MVDTEPTRFLTKEEGLGNKCPESVAFTQIANLLIIVGRIKS